MKKTALKPLNIALTLIALVAVGALAFFAYRHPSPAAPLGATASSPPPSSGIEKYVDLTGFSFTYPTGFTTSSFGVPDDPSGETVLLQSAGGEKGLQVLVTPFDEDISLTAARIQHDIPSLEMTDVTTQTVGAAGKSAQAVVFSSSNSAMGESREAWFVYEKRLYQVSAPLAAQDAFTAVIASWAF